LIVERIRPFHAKGIICGHHARQVGVLAHVFRRTTGTWIALQVYDRPPYIDAVEAGVYAVVCARFAANNVADLSNEVIDGLVAFWNRVSFGNKLLNSALISLAVAICGVLLSLLNAFALGIGRIKGTTILLVIFLLGNFLPQEALVYPLYYFSKALRLYDTKLAVILVFTVIQSAFGTYLLTSVFSEFPRELIEAAVIDGSNRFQLLTRIVLPLSIPSLSVLFVFFFIWTWNEFFLPLILLITSGNQTVPIAIATLQGQHNMDVTTSSASALLGVLPCILFFILFQRTLTRGITAGSIK
jgi:raffinose/stachyose/melibiose transport system permease protein